MSLSDYYDKQGNAITWDQYVDLLKGDDPKRVATDDIEIDGEKVWLSTVWLGIDHGYVPGGPPVIFESMIFVKSNGNHQHDNWMRRYTTLEQAEKGHAKIAADLREGRWPA